MDFTLPNEHSVVQGRSVLLILQKGSGRKLIPIKILLQVQLAPYDPSVLDASILWTESRDVGDGYRAVRMVNNINLNLDAWNADKEHGGVRDGTIVALWEWWKGDNRNQHWKIVPYCKSCNIVVQKLVVLLGTPKTCTLPLSLSSSVCSI